ncbi:hypothetical protein F5Y16DRAFT_185426 [Xylariaceae sp. FL0255]|nr:hypothetical protein F5Y16DRAFT_185426 [Xylariaceae sp. FL0255]
MIKSISQHISSFDKRHWSIQHILVLSSAMTTKPDEATPTPQAEQWGVILSEKAGTCDVRIIDDTGTPVNWIHPTLAQKFKLDIEECKSFKLEDFGGHKFKAKNAVWFTWHGKRKDRTFYSKFYLAPERSNCEMVLGNGFVLQFGRASAICCSQRLTRSSLMFATSRIQVSSKPIKYAFGPTLFSILMVSQKKERKEIDAGEKKNEMEAQEAARARETRIRKEKQIKAERDSTDSGDGTK